MIALLVPKYTFEVNANFNVDITEKKKHFTLSRVEMAAIKTKDTMKLQKLCLLPQSICLHLVLFFQGCSFISFAVIVFAKKSRNALI